jgi:hypothetical protein
MGQFLRRRLIQVVHEIPAQDAVDFAVGLRESVLEKGRELFEGAGADVAIEVREDVLDENLAPSARRKS